MAKYYKRGKFVNKMKSAYIWNTGGKKLNTLSMLPRQFVKTLIVRGIGYRSFALKNDLLAPVNSVPAFVSSTRPIFSECGLDAAQELTQAAVFEFPASRYLSVRAGHTKDLYMPLNIAVKCLTSKKDRKLAIIASNKVLAANLAKTVHLYRAPSVYTGRGVRIKHVKPIRKAGKKDKQKGRAF